MGKRKKRANGVTKSGPVVYVGPAFRDSFLSSFKVFRDGIPAEFAEDPIYSHLFVPIAGLNQAMVDVKNKGTLLHTFFTKAVAAHNKKE
jgi:hypothetical protein